MRSEPAKLLVAAFLSAAVAATILWSTSSGTDPTAPSARQHEALTGWSPPADAAPARTPVSAAATATAQTGDDAALVATALPQPGLDRAKERDLRTVFGRMVREQPSAAPDAARRLLAGDAPDAAKIAMLRALLDDNHPAACELLTYAVVTVPPVERAHGESVPATALRLLCERAATVTAASAGLWQIAFGSPRVSLPLRVRAATVCASLADVARRPQLEALATSAVEPELRDAIRRGLAGPVAATEGPGIPE